MLILTSLHQKMIEMESYWATTSSTGLVHHSTSLMPQLVSTCTMAPMSQWPTTLHLSACQLTAVILQSFVL